MRTFELVDAMLPGDGQFPPASHVGVHGHLRGRLRQLGGDALVEWLDEAMRDLDVAGIEREHPDLFARIRAVVFITYYEMPEVQEVIRALGFRYNATPLPRGYPMGRFAEADRPTHGRGHYVATGDVRRVDLSGLDFLGGKNG